MIFCFCIAKFCVSQFLNDEFDVHFVFNDDKNNTLYVVDVWKFKQKKNGMYDMMTISKFHMEKFMKILNFKMIIIN